MKKILLTVLGSLSIAIIVGFTLMPEKKHKAVNKHKEPTSVSEGYAEVNDAKW